MWLVLCDRRGGRYYVANSLSPVRCLMYCRSFRDDSIVGATGCRALSAGEPLQRRVLGMAIIVDLPRIGPSTVEPSVKRTTRPTFPLSDSTTRREN